MNNKQRTRNGNAPSSSVPEPPKKPKYFTMVDTAEALGEIPLWITGDPELKVEIDGKEVTDYNSERQLACLIRELSAYDYAKYREKFHETIDTTLGKCFHLMDLLSKTVSKDVETRTAAADALKPNGTGCIETPYGLTQGSLEEMMGQIFVFTLWCGGRVTEYLGRDEYATESIEYDDLLMCVKQRKMLRTKVDNDGSLLWYKVLEHSGIWSPEQSAKALEDLNEQVPASGNSPESNSGDS